MKLLWLAICDIEDKRALARAKEQARRAKHGKATRTITGGRLIEGAGTTGWNQALQHFALAFAERVEPYLY